MSDSVTTLLYIRGQFPDSSFCEWISDRASILSLSGWVTIRSQNLIEAEVSGHPVLVDAFEAACSLGPMTVDVQSIDVRTKAGLGCTVGFHILDN